jgi:predicted nucleic acid-binding protein
VANFPLLRLYDSFFSRADVVVLPISTNVFRQATVIQAMNDFGTVDSLHLATAVEGGCQLFLTHDSRLSRFTSMTVEILA